MCAKEDFSGYHNFANNEAEHRVNARKFQQALKRKAHQPLMFQHTLPKYGCATAKPTRWVICTMATMPSFLRWAV
jgi:hypothetical protein